MFIHRKETCLVHFQISPYYGRFFDGSKQRAVLIFHSQWPEKPWEKKKQGAAEYFLLLLIYSQKGLTPPTISLWIKNPRDTNYMWARILELPWYVVFVLDDILPKNHVTGWASQISMSEGQFIQNAFSQNRDLQVQQWVSCYYSVRDLTHSFSRCLKQKFAHLIHNQNMTAVAAHCKL